MNVEGFLIFSIALEDVMMLFLLQVIDLWIPRSGDLPFCYTFLFPLTTVAVPDDT